MVSCRRNGTYLPTQVTRIAEVSDSFLDLVVDDGFRSKLSGW